MEDWFMEEYIILCAVSPIPNLLGWSISSEIANSDFEQQIYAKNNKNK